MGKPLTRTEPQGARVPPELYYGIPRGAFRYFGCDDERTSLHRARYHEWAAKVRAAGYTTVQLRRKAETDAGYQRWLSHTQRAPALSGARRAVTLR